MAKAAIIWNTVASEVDIGSTDVWLDSAASSGDLLYSVAHVVYVGVVLPLALTLVLAPSQRNAFTSIHFLCNSAQQMLRWVVLVVLQACQIQLKRPMRTYAFKESGVHNCALSRFAMPSQMTVRVATLMNRLIKFSSWFVSQGC